MKNANAFPWVAAAIAIAGLCGCPQGPGSSRETDRAGAAAGAVTEGAARLPFESFFEIPIGSHRARLRCAVTHAELERGLMEVTKLGRDDGMIFVFGSPQPLAFWMHDTPSPLDVGYFFPDGSLAEIHPLMPFDERSVRSRSQRLQFAVEMNQGWYAHSGVHPGERLDMTALKAALQARGTDPAQFGLR